MTRIILEGAGHVYAQPNQASVQLTVEKSASSASKALASMEDAINELVKEIDGEQMTTVRLNVAPAQNDTKVIDGKRPAWVASHTMMVEIKDVKKVGDIISLLAQYGRVDNPQFSNSNAADFFDQARKAAVQDAVQKAKVYCEAAGLQYKEIEEIVEQPTWNGGAASYTAVQVFEADCKHSAAVKIAVRATKDKMRQAAAGEEDFD